MTTKTKLRLEAIEQRLDAFDIRFDDIRDTLRSLELKIVAINERFGDCYWMYHSTVSSELRQLNDKFRAVSTYWNVDFVNNGLVCEAKKEKQ